MKTSVRNLCYIAVFTAIIAVVSQLSVPLPGGVPMTLQTLIIPLAGVILGAKRGTISTLIYVLLGAVGVPVFAGFTGGIGIVLGMTGGFIVSFPLMALLAGWADSLGTSLSVKHKNNKVIYYAILTSGLVLGAVINYAVGTVWFAIASGSSMAYSFTACVAPFIIPSIIKIVLIGILGPILRHALVKSGVLQPCT